MSENLYELLAPMKPINVVDVGANPLGDPPYLELLQNGMCHLWGFEPQQEQYEKLQQQKSANETYFPIAVGPGPTSKLYCYSSSGFTSNFSIREKSIGYLNRFQRHTKLVSEETIPTVPLDEIDGLPGIDLLKIDVQGSEMQIIAGGEARLSKAVAIIPEMRFYQLYEGEPSLGDLDLELRRQGFVLHKFIFMRPVMLKTSQAHRLKWPANRNQLLDGDAVYIRSLDDPGSYSDDQLRVLAVLSHYVWQSYDLAIRCLDVLHHRQRITNAVITAYVDMLPPAVRAPGK